MNDCKANAKRDGKERVATTWKMPTRFFLLFHIWMTRYKNQLTSKPIKTKKMFSDLCELANKYESVQ
jgi:hypothetical protein